MPADLHLKGSSGLQTSALSAFAGITFLITWGVVGFYVVLPDMAASAFGVLHGAHPLFFLATWSPAIAALAVVFHHSGAKGVRAFLSRILIWRGSVGWAVFILVGLPLVFITGSLIKGGSVLAPLPPGGLAGQVAALLMMLCLGPVEELGWRGVAQPLLQRHMAPMWAGLLIGAIWGLWHLPAFWLSSTVYADWNFLPFFIGNLTLAVLVTPMFNRTRGGLLWPMLFHWQLINPFWPDARPWDTVLLVVAAVIIVWWNRGDMFTREGAVIDVVPGFSFPGRAEHP